MTEAMQENRIKALFWFPVALFPVCNLASMLLTEADNDISITWVFGAVAEELFFRGFLLKTILLPRIKPKHAIVLISLLFAAMHLLNLRSGTTFPAILPQIFFAFCFSIWAGAVVWRKGSILIPMLAHVLLNLTAVTEGMLIPLAVSVIVLADGILLLKGSENEQ